MGEGLAGGRCAASPYSVIERGVVKLLTIVVIIGCVLLGGCPPSSSTAVQPHQAASPVSARNPARSTPDHPKPTETNATRLVRDCETGSPLACSALASAYRDGSSSAAPEISQDLTAAATYSNKACQLGTTSDCYELGRAFAEGRGVQQDKKKAARFYQLSCEERGVDGNPAAGTSCWKLAEILLELDYLESYEAAMTALDRACALQSSLCAMKAEQEGTGLTPTAPPPKSALGYDFGISLKAARAICTQQGGAFDAGRDPAVCEGPRVDALNVKALYIMLGFCKHDSLCAISVGFGSTPETVIGNYISLRNRLLRTYGIPTRIGASIKPGCRTIDTLARCLRANDAQFSSVWDWNDKGKIYLTPASGGGEVGIVTAYVNDAGVRAQGKGGP
jgi:hypothetical protein